MIKLIAFDIDDTLAPLHKKAKEDTVKQLKKLEEKNYKICLISGKPVSYVAGMARQFGLSNPIISGENGSIIYFGIDFPIKKEIRFTYSEKEKRMLEVYKKTIEEKYEEFIWSQPNNVNVSFFVEDKEIRKEINHFTHDYFKDTNFEYYLHADGCFDIIYKGVNKGWAVQQIKKELQLNNTEIVTIGDGKNDLPMFKETYYSIGINRNDTLISVKDIEEVFEAIKELEKNEKVCPYCQHKKITVWEIEKEKRILGECDKCEETKDLYYFEKNNYYTKQLIQKK